MRVLHLIHTGHLVRAEPIVYALLAGSVKRGHECALCAIVRNENVDNGLAAEADKLGVATEVLTYPLPYSPRSNRELRETVLRAKVDIVHTHDYKSTWIAARALLGLKVLLVASDLGLEVDGRKSDIYRVLSRRQLPRFDYVLAIEEEVGGRRGQRLRTRLGDRLEVISSDIDLLDECLELEGRMARVYEQLYEKRESPHERGGSFHIPACEPPVSRQAPRIVEAAPERVAEPDLEVTL